MKFNRERFFALYRKAFPGSLSQSQVDGLNDLLKRVEGDSEWEDVRHVAYLLATVKHEVANTWQPIEEYGKGEGRSYGRAYLVKQKGKPTLVSYYGRGYVQLTWRDNYRVFSRLLNTDLVTYPELALRPDVAYAVLAVGMRDGLFTGVSLERYIEGEKCDYHNARRVVNGLDKAAMIAGYARRFEGVLRGSAE